MNKIRKLMLHSGFIEIHERTRKKILLLAEAARFAKYHFKYGTDRHGQAQANTVGSNQQSAISYERRANSEEEIRAAHSGTSLDKSNDVKVSPGGEDD